MKWSFSNFVILHLVEYDKTQHKDFKANKNVSFLTNYNTIKCKIKTTTRMKQKYKWQYQQQQQQQKCHCIRAWLREEVSAKSSKHWRLTFSF